MISPTLTPMRLISIKEVDVLMAPLTVSPLTRSLSRVCEGSKVEWRARYFLLPVHLWLLLAGPQWSTSAFWNGWLRSCLFNCSYFYFYPSSISEGCATHFQFLYQEVFFWTWKNIGPGSTPAITFLSACHSNSHNEVILNNFIHTFGNDINSHE